MFCRGGASPHEHAVDWARACRKRIRLGSSTLSMEVGRGACRGVLCGTAVKAARGRRNVESTGPAIVLRTLWRGSARRVTGQAKMQRLRLRSLQPGIAFAYQRSSYSQRLSHAKAEYHDR